MEQLLSEAKEAGFLEALEELFKDGVLSFEEYRHRKEARMSKKKPDTTTFNTFGGSSSTVASDASKSTTTDLAAFDLRAGSTQSTTASFDVIANFDKLSIGGSSTFQFGTSSTSSLPSTTSTSGSEAEINTAIPMPVPNQQAATQEYKICLLGDAAVGKTTFAQRFRSGKFGDDYQPTIGCEAQPVTFNTNQGPITVRVWDVAGEEKFRELRQGYYIQADAFIIMFDLTNRSSYKNVPTWYNEAVRASSTTAPMVLVGNKCDCKDRRIKPKMIMFHRRKNIQYYELSAKANYNIEKPFLYLFRKLRNDVNLSFVESPVLQPPSVPNSMQMMQQYEHELLTSVTVPLEEDDDDEF